MTVAPASNVRLFVGGIEIVSASGFRVEREVPTIAPVPVILPATSEVSFEVVEGCVSPDLIAPAEFTLTCERVPSAPAKPVVPLVIHVPSKKPARIAMGMRCSELEVTEDGFVARGAMFYELPRKRSRRERRALWPEGSRGMSFAEFVRMGAL